MKFRMFTAVKSGKRIAVNVDRVKAIEEIDGCVVIYVGETERVEVAEDFDTVFARLNTVAD